MKSLLWQLLQKRKWRSPLYFSPLTVVGGKEKTARGAQRGDEVARATYVEDGSVAGWSLSDMEGTSC